jgi:acyl carrier protein
MPPAARAFSKGPHSRDSPATILLKRILERNRFVKVFDRRKLEIRPCRWYTCGLSDPGGICDWVATSSASSNYGREVLRMAEINVAETVKKIVVENLERKPEEVTDDARFIEDLGADSLDLTELLMALEEEYNVEIDDEANDIQTVGDAIKYIESKLNN